MSGRPARPLLERLQAMYVPEPNTGCWLFTGYTRRDGYGIMGVGSKHDKSNRSIGAHRVSYELVHGPVAKGLTIDHLCRVRHCVNPDHLEAVPQRVNTLRGESPIAKAARRHECGHGHPYPADVKRDVATGARVCRKCQVINTQNYQARKRAKEAAQR